MPLAATSTKDKLLEKNVKKTTVVVHMCRTSQSFASSRRMQSITLIVGAVLEFVRWSKSCTVGDQQRLRMVTESARVGTSGLLANKRQA